MRGTHVNFRWKTGIELAPLVRCVQAFAGGHDLTLMPPEGRRSGCLEPRRSKPYNVKWWRNQKIESVESDDPIALNPLNDPDFAAISWGLYDRSGKCWF